VYIGNDGPVFDDLWRTERQIGADVLKYGKSLACGNDDSYARPDSLA